MAELSTSISAGSLASGGLHLYTFSSGGRASSGCSAAVAEPVARKKEEKEGLDPNPTESASAKAAVPKRLCQVRLQRSLSPAGGGAFALQAVVAEDKPGAELHANLP